MTTSLPLLSVSSRIGRRTWRVLAMLVAAAASMGLLVAAAQPASAHASVRSTTPFDGERLATDEVPEQVTIEFNEAVVPPPDAIRVFDDAGARVDVDGPVVGTGERVVGRALGELDDGGYIVTWAVVSADGHPLRGAFVFTVGDGPAVSDALVAEVFGGGGGIVGPLQVATTGVTYVAVLAAAGAAMTGALLRRRSGAGDTLPGWVG